MQRVFSWIVLAGATAGCVAPGGDESFIIIGHLAPAEGACTFTTNLQGPFFSVGRTDFLSGSYQVAAEFESRVVAAEGKESLRRVDIQGANISLDIGQILAVDRAGNTQLRGTLIHLDFQALFSSSLGPNGGLSIGVFDLIPFDTMAMVRAEAGDAATSNDVLASADAVATVTAFGDFYGDRIDATEWRYPITITNQNRLFIQQCPLPANFATPDPVNSCSQFQDTTVLCCAEADGTASCPPRFAVCGDGACNGGETNSDCPADCP